MMFAYLTESSGLTVTGTQVLNGRDFRGWSAAGMQDMNGDGHPDLILTNDSTGETIVNYYGGELGVSSLGSDSVDSFGLVGLENRSPEYAGNSNREEHATFISYTLSVRIDSRSRCGVGSADAGSYNWINVHIHFSSSSAHIQRQRHRC